MNDEEASFHATRDVYHKLQLILPKVLKNDGELIPREIWDSEKMENETVLNQTANMNDRAASISLARSRLKRVEELLDVFSFLRSSLENQISSFRARMPKWSITDLPNELLLLIFDYSEPDQRCLRDLLQVCKRFRQLVLSSPRLWARQTLGLHSSPYYIGAVAERSGELGFRVGFDNEDDFEGSFGPEHAIVQLCDKWSSLTLNHIERIEQLDFLRCVPSTKLISLKELTISLRGSAWNTWLFSSYWPLPQLKSLTCFHCVPRFLCATSLSECSFTFHVELLVKGAIDFLSSAPCVEKLTIALQLMDGRRLQDFDGAIATTLPNLKHLIVRINEVHQSIIDRLFQTILSPNITSFLAIVGLKGARYDASRSLQLLTKGLKVRYPALKRVGLGAISGKFGAERNGEPLFIHDVNETLNELPRSVEDLVLLFNNQDCDADIPRSDVETLDGLRSLGFVHCNHLTEFSFFRDLPHLLKKYGVTLDDIHFDNCDLCACHASDESIKIEDFMRENDVEGRLLREGVTKKVSLGSTRSVVMVDMLASLKEFLRLFW